MNLIIRIAAFLWFGRIAENVIAFSRLWHVKEYRLDRMFIHLKTNQGKRIYFIPWRFPIFSPKSFFLIIGTLIILGYVYIILPFPVFINLFLIDLISFPVTALMVVLLSAPTKIYHQNQIAKAKEILQNHKPMLVIGITGSYGKTSTKEYLYEILSTKYKVLKTRDSKNSPIGIAEVIISDLKPEHEIFIVEMGAYKQGEIKGMCEIVKPSVGIVTAINAQHQDLFGSIENTVKAKFELIEGLSGKKIAILNSDNEYTRQMMEKARESGKNLWVFGKEKNSDLMAQNYFYSEKIEVTDHNISFVISNKTQKEKVQANILGEHQVINILAAIAGAVASGMTLKDAAKATTLIKPIAKTIQPVTGINGSLFINDTFNNNPDAAIAALKFLERSKGKKILVFQPMIELGAYADSSHERVGEIAGNICDSIILTNNNFYPSFANGVVKSSHRPDLNIFTPKKAAQYIKNHVSKNDTVLFKGKESEQVLHELMH